MKFITNFYTDFYAENDALIEMCFLSYLNYINGGK